MQPTIDARTLTLLVADRTGSEADAEAAAGKDAVIRALRDDLLETRAQVEAAVTEGKRRLAAAEADAEACKSAASAAASAAAKTIAELQRQLQEMEVKSEQLATVGRKMREENERVRAR